MFKSPAKDAKDALMKGKKRKKMTKKSGINLELEKLKPYFEAYNITPNDLFFSRKKWAFKSNSKKGNETKFDFFSIINLFFLKILLNFFF